ncbi:MULTISPECIES: hypothetical protein [unclassified Pseudoalteromonas]|uniref:hypothetical protein n=1 Tax=unclassified Pseudoalteromonas TaxID=194690 RepID=UPI0025B31790|nr:MULTISPECIES: hypothetical protein [unclassified Pseudoalteromonas]MDN3380897.1 hypothetical protein [Pseudoalteromonas sp. APC 3893]MDN3389304.1 hypothetical protein [Pseudoalteromonas sp. APC 4017]
MSSIRNYIVNVPDADSPCSLDLHVPALCGDNLLVPFGEAEVQTKNNPKTADQIPQNLVITPRVFIDPSLDKSIAAEPNYIEQPDNFVENTACGYLYLFVDGFLWREYAALGFNGYSEIDLTKEHSLDVRNYSGAHVKNIIIPTAAKNLYNGSSLNKTKVEVAFSRVQWSWDYICTLGGMFESDKRLSLKPLLQKCDDTTKAADYRAQRCTLLDFTQGKPPILDSDGTLYLHDKLGIAHRLFLQMEMAKVVMQFQYDKLKSKPFYDSAILAYQLYLNEKLHKKVSKYSHVTGMSYEQPKDLSSEASSLRDVAEYLDREEVEKWLISDTAIKALEDYLQSRKQLTAFFEDKYENEALQTICDNSNVAPIPNWNSTVRDLTCLNKNAYGAAVSTIYQYLNATNERTAELPIFIKPITDSAKKNELKKSLADAEKEGQALAKNLCNDSQSFVRTQLSAKDNAYGQDFNNAQYASITSDKSQEPGTFDPDKWQIHFTNIAQAGHSLGNTETLIAHVLKTSDKILTELIKYWKRAFDPAANPNVSKLQITVIGASLKASGIEPYGNIKIHNFNDIPEGHTIIGVDIVENTLFKEPKLRRASKALDRVINAIDNNKKPSAKDISIIAGNVPREVTGDKGAHGTVTITDSKTGKTIGVQASKHAAAFIQKGLDTKNFAKDLSTLTLDVLTLPTDQVTNSMLAAHYNNLNPIKSTAMRLPSTAKLMDNWIKSNPGTFFLLDSISTINTYKEYKKNFEGKGFFYELAKNIASISSVIISSAQVYEAYFNSRTAMSKAMYTEAAKKLEIKGGYTKGTVLFTKLRFVAGLASGLTSALLIWDAYDLNKKGQHGAALASLIGGGLGIVSALHGAVFVSMGPFGWAFLIGSIVSGLIVSYLTLTDAEIWAKYGPFSKDSSQRIQLDKQSSKATVPANNKYEPFVDPTLYMRFITSVLFSPQVVIKHLQGTHYVIEINLPLYNNHNSDVYLNVGLKRFARGAQSLNVDIKPINVPKNGQPILSQTKWGVKEIASLQPLQFQRNDNGQITKAVSFGMFDDNYVFNVSAKARVDIEGVSYPQKLISYKTIDEEKANPEDATDWQSAVLHL